MHKIDKDIIDALNRLIDDCGSALEVERRTGVTNSTLSKYRSGKIPRMNDSTWAALEPFLRPFLNHASRPSVPQETDRSVQMSLPLDYLNHLIRKIITSSDLSKEERIKFIRLLLEFSDETR